MVIIGERAPEFMLKDQHDKEVKLSDFHSKKVLLAFYPADWSPVCTNEMKCFKDDLAELEKLDLHILAISVDSLWSHKAWAEHMGIGFSILSDFNKDVVRTYGFLRPEGFSERAYVFIDENGIVRWKHIMPVPSQRLENADIIKALENLK